MRAVVLQKNGRPLSLRERPIPVPGPGEVLVRVRACGVCHSDLDVVEEPERTPLVPGHEFAGEAEGIGPVLVHPAWGCGRCASCRRGEEQLCPEAEFAGFSKDGGYAEYAVVPGRRHLFPIPDLDPVRACVLADAGLTAYRAVRRVRDVLRHGGKEPGSAIAVIGGGGVGQFAVQFLRILTPARILCVEKDPAKRALVRSLGAHETLSSSGRLPEVQAVLDIVGSAETLADAAGAVAPGGLLMLVGAAGGTIPFGLEEHVYEACFHTSINGSLHDLADVLELVRRGALTRWEVEALPLGRAVEALDRLRRGDARGRLVLVP